ncbi:receptor kinase-like protein Xa21 [Iris pallida]|uniref:non-specific serine/threonine protein kinase n=1 Tax=Iris pallida TaxID=29817 RepID=A0AAX6GJI8_IRIPA|nr:receptor kinase-like protein Xa21 [Iris pallida]
METPATSCFLSRGAKFMLLILLNLCCCCCCLRPTMQRHNNFTDLSALLAFKSSVADPNHDLINWTTNTSFCSWTGVYCNRQRRQQQQQISRVVALRLRGLSLQGTITPLLSNLSFLNHLDLSNNSLGGSIPDALGSLPRLRLLNLEINQLVGDIPPAIFNMSNSLSNVSLASNGLSGTLPANFTLHRLQYMSLQSNHYLTGEIPSSFGSCKDLRFLSLSTNQFTGKIPTELTTSLPELRVLWLDNNNLTGTIPASTANLSKLTQLDLSVNSLTGGIPTGLGNALPNVQWMNLAYNGLTGQIPSSLPNATLTRFLDLSINQLSGPVPLNLGNMRSLVDLSLGWNWLQGSLDFIALLSNCRALVNLHFLHNELDGVIPAASVGNLSSATLSKLTASGNRIKGGIPAELGNLSSLLFLNLHTNALTGTIPLAITKLSMLQAFYIGFNSIHGDIPRELGEMTALSQLGMEANSLSGPIPDSIGNLTGLQYLALDQNRLSRIPPSMWSLRGLTVLSLPRNSLRGSLPPGVGNLKAMTYMDLSINQLEGSIPDAFGELQMLESLDLSSNSFQGLIPDSFGGLISIKTLNLSRNAFTGAIPSSLARLRYLVDLNLSLNSLEGRIPNGGIFSTLTRGSLEGNVALCGAPRLNFRPCSSEDNRTSPSKKLRPLKFVLPFVAAVALSVAVCYLLLRTIQRKRRANLTSTDDLTPNMNVYRSITYQELLRATDTFNESNLLGTGALGSVFKGQLDDGLVVAVKVLDLGKEGASRGFESETRALRALRHRNLIRIISVCSNVDFKALVLQYMSNGSLDSWLHSPNDRLSLLQRMNIMLDVAMALEYLHHHHPQVVVHCDLKPSNVLLDEDMTAHVSDFGIAKLLNGDSNSIATLSAPGTIGYMAPEYGMSGKISRWGDIYSYGVLLLETFTGKKPTDATFHGELTLRQWVSEAHSKSELDILDDRAFGNEDPDVVHRCLLAAIEIGLLCSKESPAERISMKDVVPRLAKIKEDYLSGVV